jgi:hypothetical protein
MASKKEQSLHKPEPSKATDLDIQDYALSNSPVMRSVRASKSGYSGGSSPVIGQIKTSVKDREKIPVQLYSTILTEDSPRSIWADFTVKPIEHTGELAREYLSRMSSWRIESPEELLKLCIEYRSLFLKTHRQMDLQIAMMAGRLALYENMAQVDLNPVLTPRQYFKYCFTMGHAFADTLKKAKSLATLSTLSEHRFIDLKQKIDEFNSDYGHIITIDEERNYSYDDFLNEDNLIFFMDKTVNDIEWAHEPLDFDKGAHEEFRAVLKELLGRYKVHNLQSPCRSEKALWTSDSTSFSVDPLERTIHRNIVRERIRSGSKNPFGELTTDFVLRRSIIPVGPANFRDAWEPNFDTLFTIKSISHVMRPVVQNIPFSAMYDAVIAHRRKSALKNSASLFLMLDYKKSALTIPRQLVTIMGEELESLYSNIEFKYISAYENLKLYVDGKENTPVRGVGLGNMNELFTLMQCVFGYMHKKASGLGSIFFNDDAAYQLDSTYYRRQVILMLSFIRRTGNILNLSKCLISKGTIFCEEYDAPHGFDYRKRQLLVIPIIGSLFSSNTAIAKKYFYSIDRGLVGTGFRNLNREFLQILSQFYKNEFGKMDYYLPYHLGGWYDFSISNFSCLIEYIVDPGAYLKTPNQLGSIPEIKRWIRYLLLKGKSGTGLLSSRAKIPYRGKTLTNPLRSDEIFKERSHLRDYLYDYVGLIAEDEYEQIQDDCVQFRGLHNAKPRIRMGIDDKTLKMRKNIFNDFKKCNAQFGLLFSKDVLSLNIALRVCKTIPDCPAYFSYPRCFVKESWPVIEGNKNRIVYYKKSEDTSYSIVRLRDSMASTIESLESNRWYYRSDPFIFYEAWRRRKSGYIIADTAVPKLSGVGLKLPRDFRAFCPNAKLFACEMAVRTNSIPLSYTAETDMASDYQMHLFKDAFENILPPDLIGDWRDIKIIYKDNLHVLRSLLSGVNLCSRREYKAFLYAARAFWDECPREVPTELNTVDDDILELLERFEEEDLYTRLISDVYTVEELIEDDGYFNQFDSFSEESEIGRYGSDYEIDSDDSEVDSEGVDLNEIRRLGRNYRVFDTTGMM